MGALPATQSTVLRGLAPHGHVWPVRRLNYLTGRRLYANDDYLTESIKDPQAKIVAGFENQQMPQSDDLTDENIADIIAYIKTLR